MWSITVRLLTMAWRNVWRNQRRSMVTIAAMTLGMWAMILYSGLAEGMLVDMASSVTDLEMGEIQVVHAEYRDDPALQVLLPDPEVILSGLDTAGLPASARLLGGGLAGVDQSSAGVSLIGLNVERDRAVSDLPARMQDGQWLDPTAPRGVVLGRKLARTLQADLGDEVLVLSQAADGSIANDVFVVRGVLGMVSDNIDRTTMFLNEETFRELMVVPTGAHLITVRVPSDRDLLESKALVQTMAGGQDVQTWRELLPLISQWLDATRGMLFIVYIIMYIAIAILVLNAMLMAVFERVREFGVMKAIGYGPITVFSLITLESVVQIAVATVLALVLSVPFMGWLSTVGINVGALAGMNIMGMSMMENWRGVFSMQVIITPVVVLWCMVIGAVMFPAFRAARLNPIAAMRTR